MQRLGRKGKDKLFNFRPLFFMAASLCVGVVFCYLHFFFGLSLWWLFLLVGLGIPFIFCGKEMLIKTAISVFALLAAFFVGFACFGAQMRAYIRATVYEGEYSVQGRVEEKTEGRTYSCLVLSDITVGENAEKYKLIAYLPASFCENVDLFDVVSLVGAVTTEGTEYSAESFNAYTIREHIKYKMTDVESCIVVGRKFDLFGSIRVRIEKALYRGMDDEPASVAMAVLTGNTHDIESGLLTNMRYGGIAHIFAVSGLHVGALYGFCMWLTSKTGLKRAPKIFRFLLVAAVLLFYGGICGFSASILRATILCLVGYAAKLIGTKVDKLETLGLAAIIVLLLSPIELFSVGFQLSFLACLGIFLYSKPLDKWGNHVCDEIIKRVRARREKAMQSAGESTQNARAQEDEDTITFWGKVRNMAISFTSVSLAAQIATAPVLLQTFGYLSGWSLLLNFFFVPFIGAVFSWLLLFTVAACLLPLAASPVVLYLPNVVWSAVLLLFEGFDFSTFAIKGVTLTASAFACYYLALSFLADKWNLTIKQRKWFGLLCGAGFVVVVLISNIV